MMRRNSPPSELVFRENKVEQVNLRFFKEFETGDNFIIVKIHFV